MKKLLILVLTVLFILIAATVSSAATVTISGNARFWFEGASTTNTDPTKSANVQGFAFDRLALNANVDFGNNTGLKNQIQFRQIKDTVDVSNSIGNADIRVESYYYKKGVFMATDEIDIGAFGLNVYLPFKNGSGSALINGGLGDGLKIGQTLGVIYTINSDVWDLGIGIGNAKQGFVADGAGTDGLDYSVRFNIKPIAGVKIGAGYEVVGMTTAFPSTGYSYNMANYYDTRWIVDASYNVAPFGALVEYASVNSTVAGNTTMNAFSGMYGELSYTAGPGKVYVGRTFGDNDYNSKGLFGGRINGYLPCLSSYNTNCNYTVIGGAYTISGGPTLGVEYVRVDDNAAAGTSGRNVFGVRCLINF